MKYLSGIFTDTLFLFQQKFRPAHQFPSLHKLVLCHFDVEG